MELCQTCGGYTAVEADYSGRAVQRCTCSPPPVNPQIDPKLCDVCDGMVGPAPDGYIGPGIHACYCAREDHKAEQAFKAQGDGSGTTVSFSVGDTTKVVSKGPGQ